MSEKISVVTDSTSSLSPKFLKDSGIGVIPAVFIFNNKAYRDGVDFGLDKFIDMLKTLPVPPTTGAPPLGEYLETYNKLSGNILSIHLGSGFSGIFTTAVSAANEIGTDRIHPIDSRSAALGTGFMVMRAVEMIENGADLKQIVDEIESMKTRTTVYAALDTLEYASKGGRISHLAALTGAALNIKPILEIRDNKIETAAKVRTRSKSLDTLVELTESLGPLERVGVLHANTPKDADTVVEKISRFHKGEIILGNITPALVSHGGPGILGVCALKKK